VLSVTVPRMLPELSGRTSVGSPPPHAARMTTAATPSGRRMGANRVVAGFITVSRVFIDSVVTPTSRWRNTRNGFSPYRVRVVDAAVGPRPCRWEKPTLGVASASKPYPIINAFTSFITLSAQRSRVSRTMRAAGAIDRSSSEIPRGPSPIRYSAA
jgi:hypothetical protein